MYNLADVPVMMVWLFFLWALMGVLINSSVRAWLWAIKTTNEELARVPKFSLFTAMIKGGLIWFEYKRAFDRIGNEKV